MTGLIVFLLLILATIYGLSFLFFKVIWLIFSKHKNFWPLILAGISTFLIILASIGFAWWGVNKVIFPFVESFHPMKERVELQPQPQYGLRNYTDPVYGFTLQLPDGMDYSEWINFPGISLKLGINTNVLKKDSSGKEIKEPFVISALIYQTQNVDEKNPFDKLKESIAKISKDRRLDIKFSEEQITEGKALYQVSGIAYSNRGPFPFWGQVVLQDKALIYIITSDLSNSKELANDAANLATSLQAKGSIPAPKEP